jgi:hypothetical protein
MRMTMPEPFLTVAQRLLTLLELLHAKDTKFDPAHNDA